MDQCNAKIDAILENERQAQNSWAGREKIPEPIRELLDVYVHITGQKPTKGKLMDWLSTGQEWLELGASQEDIHAAYKKSKPDNGRNTGFMVSRPGSLTNTIGMIVGERHITKSSAVQSDPMATMNDYLKRKEVEHANT